MAGAPIPAPLILPVQLSLVPDAVSSLDEASAALQQATLCCTLLGNQHGRVRDTFSLRAALVARLLLHVLPAPLPLSHPKRDTDCFWQSASGHVRADTQAALLRWLGLLGRHYAAATFGLPQSAALDATRMLVLAAAAALADAVARLVAVDVPSAFSLHFGGNADGVGGRCFAVDLRCYEKESERGELHQPQLAAARTAVLDYFRAAANAATERRLCFGYEKTMGLGRGERALVRQLCSQLGHAHRADAALAKLISGEDSQLTHLYPELATLRDLAYLAKASMCPSADALPDTRAWAAADAELHWKWRDEKATFAVHGFGKELHCGGWADESAAAAADVPPPPGAPPPGVGPPPGEPPGGDRRSAAAAGEAAKAVAGRAAAAGVDGLKGGLNFMRRVANTLGIARAPIPRLPPSSADPSNLAGERLESEEDVLHVRHLPEFGGYLRASDAEVLLQSLLVPYLRVPLLLRFFAEPTRTMALAHAPLQRVLDAALFEPGEWQPDEPKALPALIPAPNRAHLHTPCGLLLHELSHSPDVPLASVVAIVQNA